MIKIYKQDRSQAITEVVYKQHTFPGGEEHIVINGFVGSNVKFIKIDADLRDSRSILQLLLIKQALDVILLPNPALMVLSLSYLPYARQDRIANIGEAHSLKVMCNLINSMKFDKVITHDAHSDVALALIDNVINIGQVGIISQIPELVKKLDGVSPVFVAPDAGAVKKSMSVAKSMKRAKFATASKHRDTITGEISHISFDGDSADITGEDVFIVDDICDGGGTFIGLAEVLKVYEPKSLNLVITNGIFSKGKKELEEAFDSVYVLFDWTVE